MKISLFYMRIDRFENLLAISSKKSERSILARLGPKL